MKYFLYDTDTWELLNVPRGCGPEPATAIDKATPITIPVNAPQYSKRSTWTPAWVATADAKLVCVCADDVTAALLNADFDAEQKLWYGRVVRVTHQKDMALVACDEITARLLRKAIPQEDNVLTIDGDASFLIKSFPTLRDEIELTDADGNAVAFDADEHNNRGVCITGRGVATVECHVESNDDINIADGDSADGVTESYTKLHDGDTAAVGLGVQNLNKATAAAAECTIEWDVTVPRMPVRYENSLNIRLSITSDKFNVADYTNTSVPYIDIYNITTSAWVRIRTYSYDEMYAIFYAGTMEHITIALSDMLDYWNTSTHKIKFRMFSGCVEDDATNHFWSNCSLKEFCFTAKLYSSNVSEFRILDTKDSDTLELAEDSEVYDTFVNEHSIGDIVQILANDEEWLEDTIITLARKIAAINAPTSTKPTLFGLHYKPVSQNFDDIKTRNAWYWYVTRVTVAGEPDIDFVEKSDPTDHGLLVEPGDFGKNVDPVEDIDAFQKVSQVIVKNKTSVGKWPAAPDASDLPELVLQRNDIPDAYLLEIATAIYGQRDAASSALALKIATLAWNFKEGFESYPVAASRPIGPGDARWNAWNANGNGDFSVVAGQKGYFNKDGGAAWTVYPSFTFATAQPAAASGNCGYTLRLSALPQNYLYLYLQNAAGTAQQFFMIASTGAIYTSDNAGISASLATLAINTDYVIRVVSVAAGTHDVVINGTTYDKAGAHYTKASGRSDAFAKLTFGFTATSTGAFYIDDIVTSWATAGPDVGGIPDVAVQDAPDSAFHVGALVHVHAMPTTLGGVDYQIDADYVIRELKWTHDGCAELKLGFDEASTESVDETIDKILTRHAND